MYILFLFAMPLFIRVAFLRCFTRLSNVCLFFNLAIKLLNHCTLDVVIFFLVLLLVDPCGRFKSSCLLVLERHFFT